MQELISAAAHRSMKAAQPYAEALSQGSMNAVIKITRGAEPVFNETSRELEIDEDAVVYGPESPEKGIAGVYSTSGPVQMAIGDEPQYYSSTNVVIPRSAANPRIDDIIEVLEWTTEDTPDDIVGRVFRVVDVEVGGRLAASTRMQAIGVAPSRQWGP